MQSHPTVIYGNGAHVTITSPALYDYNVIFNGTLTPTTYNPFPSLSFNDGVTNVLNSVSAIGQSAQLGAEGILSTNSGLIIENGIRTSFAILDVSGPNVVLNGVSAITNESSFNESGYFGPDRYTTSPFTLNGELVVTGNSHADLSTVLIQGKGTIVVDDGATVDVDKTVAGLQAYVGNGTLVDSNYARTPGESIGNGMNFLGTIHEGPLGNVDVAEYEFSAVKEIFNRSTGSLQLLDISGATVAALKFAGPGVEYATPFGFGGLDITTSIHAGSLPITFTH